MSCARLRIATQLSWPYHSAEETLNSHCTSLAALSYCIVQNATHPPGQGHCSSSAWGTTIASRMKQPNHFPKSIVDAQQGQISSPVHLSVPPAQEQGKWRFWICTFAKPSGFLALPAIPTRPVLRPSDFPCCYLRTAGRLVQTPWNQ